jgi:hypothetical protein
MGEWFYAQRQAIFGINESRLETSQGVKWNYPRKSPCSSIPVMDDTFAPMEVRVAVESKRKAVKSSKTKERKKKKKKRTKSGNNDPFNQVYG